ncbi:hypothetical protein [Streptomyces sp. 8N616]|uniref:hypothetical protein n=1 Tax=Streptomyces sp. 8N616 TaxID=3457414 RepID=UPI003FCFD15C
MGVGLGGGLPGGVDVLVVEQGVDEHGTVVPVRAIRVSSVPQTLLWSGVGSQ